MGYKYEIKGRISGTQFRVLEKDGNDNALAWYRGYEVPGHNILVLDLYPMSPGRVSERLPQNKYTKKRIYQKQITAIEV